MTCQLLQGKKLECISGRQTGNKQEGGINIMTEITSKELQLSSDALTAEGLLCKKARAYSKTLTDVDLASVMTRIADEHEQRYSALLSLIGG